MRSSLLLLTAAVTTVYLMSLILVHLYIHQSLDGTTSDEENPLTAAEEGPSHSIITDEQLLLLRRLDADHRSGSALNPIPDDENIYINNSVNALDRCIESRRVVAGPSSQDEAEKVHRRAVSRRTERLRSQPQTAEDHLHPSHSRCTDMLPATAAGNGDADSSDSFRPIGEEFLYSAYWDDRVAAEPAIRIIALLKKPAKKNEVHSDLFCHVPRSSHGGDYSPPRKSFQVAGGGGGNGSSSTVGVVSVAATFYEMCENHGKEFGGWILSCRLTPAEVVPTVPPCSVYVSQKSTQSQLNETGVIRLRVLRTRLDNPPRAEEKEEEGRVGGPSADRFAVCVPPLFGRISEKTFTDFVELSRILGADHLFFYVPHPVPPELRGAVDRYVRRGVVTAVPWTVPVPETGVWYSGQLLAINDCLYRSMHAFQFVAFNDLDEFVVPHRHSHWPEMIDALKTTPPTTTAVAAAAAAEGEAAEKKGETTTTYCGYSFKSAFFDPLTQSSSGAGHRVDYHLDSNVRTKSFSRIRNKLIVAPSLLFELGIHHISRPLDADKCSVLKVDPQTAFVHHYRECTTSFDGKMNCRSLCQDDSMSTFLSVLRS